MSKEINYLVEDFYNLLEVLQGKLDSAESVMDMLNNNVINLTSILYNNNHISDIYVETCDCTLGQAMEEISDSLSKLSAHYKRLSLMSDELALSTIKSCRQEH